MGARSRGRKVGVRWLVGRFGGVAWAQAPGGPSGYGSGARGRHARQNHTRMTRSTGRAWASLRQGPKTRTAHEALPDPDSPSRQRFAMPQPDVRATLPAASSRSRRPVRPRAPCDVMARFDWRFYRQSNRAVRALRRGQGGGFRVPSGRACLLRESRRHPKPALAPTLGTTDDRQIGGEKTQCGPDSARREAGQPPSAALMLALTAPMSARPAAFALTAPITLPMSFMELAPVVAMASLMRASTSAAESWSGR